MGSFPRADRPRFRTRKSDVEIRPKSRKDGDEAEQDFDARLYIRKEVRDTLTWHKTLPKFRTLTWYDPKIDESTAVLTDLSDKEIEANLDKFFGNDSKEGFE